VLVLLDELQELADSLAAEARDLWQAAGSV
jgi:hypothetical protein